MKKNLYIFYLFFASALPAQEWENSYADALADAKVSGKPILLVFSGSDWCAPCIHLDRKVWQSDVFRDHAKKNYVLYKADFPKKKSHRLPDAVAERNNALAERYNPKGNFPLIVLLGRDGAVLGKTGYHKGAPEEYVDHLNALIK
ncbi:MAG TPA: thioredoxin family protein [Pricia sp.]|nr:thioredoxin family protein [Pricia sp.]